MIETRENVALIFGNDTEIKGYEPIKPEDLDELLTGAELLWWLPMDDAGCHEIGFYNRLKDRYYAAKVYSVDHCEVATWERPVEE